MLGPWIALLLVVVGALCLAYGLATGAAALIAIGFLVLVSAAIIGAKGSFVRHDEATPH